ncbi:hypothetical protein [Streptococcus catagoni]|uniref:hypothetical protein n=1 Tax=Streptococcus catagoni TaxID=2654874 RepID=UPI00140BB526|nr:hypothetical protein [Streptococcus catagoni]
MTKHQFPLVADNEPIIDLPRKMYLYENEDLISNIHGFYQDKDYTAIALEDQSTSHNQNPSNHLAAEDEGRSYAEEARKRAREDLKAKRQAHIAKEMSFSTKPTYRKPSCQTIKEPKKEISKIPKRDNKWSRLTEKLHQDAYILAELPKHYKEPKQAAADKNQKNSYEFLKRSQIYNNKETRVQREKTIAQELNLTRLEEQN